MYVEDLKESEHLSRFLDLAVEVLKINAKSIDASKFDITKFEIDDFIAAEREIAWLVIHLYYLSLQYLSSLTRVWWINSRNRVKLPLESWTDKYVRGCDKFRSICLQASDHPSYHFKCR